MTAPWVAALEDLASRLELPVGGLGWRGPGTGLVSPLPVEALAMGSVGVAGLAAARWRGIDPGGVVVDAARVGATFRGDQLVTVGGERVAGFAPLSGFWRATDGWVRTHANYPHHRARLVEALGTEDVAAAVAERSARDVEDAVTAAGGIAVAVRSRAGWNAHPQGRAVGVEPLVSVRRRERRGRPAPSRPRVLDLTRVVAGPVATRTLALLGADVLRVDPPGLPELAGQHVDTGPGKRTTVLDAASPRFTELVDGADVVVTGYRPGALDRFGLDPEALLARRADLVVVRLDAWGWSGPWAGRRGFDSIVQAACGVAAAHARDGRPGALPAQALDHATGYLAAASALIGLAERGERGGSVRELALARTAEWLFGAPFAKAGAIDGEPELQTLGDVRLPPPPLVVPGAPDRWTRTAHPLGADAAAWLAR